MTVRTMFKNRTAEAEKALIRTPTAHSRCWLFSCLILRSILLTNPRGKKETNLNARDVLDLLESEDRHVLRPVSQSTPSLISEIRMPTGPTHIPECPFCLSNGPVRDGAWPFQMASSNAVSQNLTVRVARPWCVSISISHKLENCEPASQIIVGTARLLNTVDSNYTIRFFSAGYSVVTRPPSNEAVSLVPRSKMCWSFSFSSICPEVTRICCWADRIGLDIVRSDPWRSMNGIFSHSIGK